MSRRASAATSADAVRVIEDWRGRMERPGQVRVTDDLRKAVESSLLLGYSAEDLLALVRYAFEADAPGPRWWRGENPDGKRYVHLSSLLRRAKLSERVHDARDWADRQDRRDRDRDRDVRPRDDGRRAARVLLR